MPTINDTEPNYHNCKVEQSHINSYNQIKQFRQAGIRLAQYRKDLYDFNSEEEIDMNLEDPTRRPDFGLADAAALTEHLENRKAAAIARSKRTKPTSAADPKPVAEPPK